MNICVTQWYYSLYSIVFLAVYGVDITVLKVGVSSRVSVFSLWNYTGVHCDKGNVLYRHSFLDNIKKRCIFRVSNS